MMQQYQVGCTKRLVDLPVRWFGLVLLAVASVLVMLPASARAASLTYAATPQAVVFGQTVTVTGTVESTDPADPAGPGRDVIVAFEGVDVATVTTEDDGRFAVTFTPEKSGAVTARLADGTTGAAVPVAVQPAVTLKVLSKSVFGSATLDVTVAPGTWTGPATATVIHHSKVVASVSFTVQSATQRLRVPLPGVGAFTVRVTLPAANGLAQRVASVAFTVKGPRIAVGSRGPAVRALLTQLRRLRFRVPGISSTLSRNAADSIMAFQKAYGLPRTYVFDADDWRKLDVASVIRARYAKPTVHIEIDKRRQILMVVKYGKPYGIICVSTGATGNTPEGRHRIMWKAYAAYTPYGNTFLFWDMQFYPRYAMHAYPFVPPYPASHGCVREPTWVAPWTYNQSFTGETVYVYR